MTKTADIIVIGAGMAGMSVASLLAENASVIVLERESQIGYHSTGRSAAMFIANYGNETIRRLNHAARPDLEGGLLGDSVLSPRGKLMVATEETLGELESDLTEANGMERLSPDEACTMVPILRREKIVAATYEADAQEIDVDLFLQGCNRMFREHGGTLVCDQEANAIRKEGSSWRVSTLNGDYTAPIVINAGGAWADELGKMAGLAPIGLTPMRRSAAIMKVPEELSGYRQWPIVISADESWYAKPEATGLMVSPGDEDPVPPQDIYPDDMVLAGGIYRFEQMTRFPVTKPTHVWAGLRSFVADRTPVVGFDPGAEGFFWLAGQGGYGIQTAPAMARLARALIAGETPAIDAESIAALSPERLQQGGEP